MAAFSSSGLYLIMTGSSSQAWAVGILPGSFQIQCRNLIDCNGSESATPGLAAGAGDCGSDGPLKCPLNAPAIPGGPPGVRSCPVLAATTLKGTTLRGQQLAGAGHAAFCGIDVLLLVE